MPIYAFRCAACGHDFDRLQKLSDPDPAACPECGEPQVQRRLTAPQFRLAGGGWYETDFKKDGEKKRNLVGDAAPASGGSEPKSDAKASASKPAEAKPAASQAPAKPDSKPAAP